MPIVEISSDRIICNHTWLLCDIPKSTVKNSVLENFNANALTPEKENIRYLEIKHFNHIDGVFKIEHHLITNFSAN